CTGSDRDSRGSGPRRSARWLLAAQGRLRSQGMIDPMPIDIKVPSVGESVSEGTLVRWLKRDGDTVQVDDPIFELETEKATSDIPAPATGRLSIVVPEGSTVPIGATVGQITEPSLVEFVPPAPDANQPPAKRQALDDGAKTAAAQAPPMRPARGDEPR